MTIDGNILSSRSVLIESDWNLKCSRLLNQFNLHFSINRIRLEFKGHSGIRILTDDIRINRIRLEFKAGFADGLYTDTGSINRIRLEFKANRFIKHVEIVLVLIESDWNLKEALLLISDNAIKY